MIHRYVAIEGNPDRPTLLLLHGTGGTENDLVPIGQQIAPDWPILSPLGNHREGQAARFFRRFAEGLFDLEDLKKRAQEMDAFLYEAAAEHGWTPGRFVALGYSNGANMAAAMALLHPGSVLGAVCLRPMVPIIPDHAPDLKGKSFLLRAGQHDGIVPPAGARELQKLLESSGAQVTTELFDGGHELSRADFESAQRFLESNWP